MEEPIGKLRPGTVFRLPGSGELGHVLRRIRTQGLVYVAFEQSNTLAPPVTRPPDLLVEVVADPSDLSAAYVYNPAVRALVEATLEGLRRDVAAALDNALWPKGRQ